VAPLSGKQFANELDVDRPCDSSYFSQGSNACQIRGNSIQKKSARGISMLYLGIDIGKNTHNASLINGEGKLLVKGFSFMNSLDGGEALQACLEPHSGAEQIVIGMEATGHYWLVLYSFLFEKGYCIHVINPIQTDGWRKGIEIRKRKTDSIDSALIADLIRYGSFAEAALSDETLFSLRTLTRFRSYLIDSIADLKRKVICVLDQVFPEYESLFSNIFGTTSKQLLLEFTTPGDLEVLHVDDLAKILEEASRHKLGLQKAQELSKAAVRSFGVTFSLDAFSFQLRQLLLPAWMLR